MPQDFIDVSRAKRIKVYITAGKHPRYQQFVDRIPNTVGSAAAIMRKLAFEGWPEANEVGDAWWRGDSAWIQAWQQFDAARLAWYAQPKGKKPVFGTAPGEEDLGKHVVIKPAPAEGDRNTVPLPIPEIAKGGVRLTYKLWLDPLEPRHAQIIQVYEEMPEAQKRAGLFQTKGRLALVLASENPEVQRMLEGL